MALVRWSTKQIIKSMKITGAINAYYPVGKGPVQTVYQGVPHNPGLSLSDLFTHPDADKPDGFANLVTETTALGHKDKSLKGTVSIGPTPVLILSDSRDFRWVLKKYSGCLVTNESTPLFKRTFKDSPMSLPTGPKWRSRRNHILDVVGNATALTKNIPIIKNAANKSLTKMRDHKDSPIDIRQMASKFIMDTMLHVSLGIEDLKLSDSSIIRDTKLSDAEIKDNLKIVLSDFITHGVDTAVTLNNVTWLNISETYTRGKLPIASDEITDAAKEFVEREILIPNKDQILGGDTYLRRVKETIEKEEKRTLNDKDLVEIILFFLTAGTDTSEKLFEFVLATVAQHPEVFQKLVEEVAKLNKPPEEWTEEEIKGMHYADCVVWETLRLLSPIAFQKAQVDKPFRIPLVPTDEKTDPASIKEWVELKPGDHICFNVDAAHRSAAVFESPDEFKPERFAVEGRYDGHLKQLETLPFGYGARDCAGQKTAKLEVKMFLLMLAYKYRNHTLSLEHPWSISEIIATFAKRANPKQPLRLVIKEKNKILEQTSVAATSSLRPN